MTDEVKTGFMCATNWRHEVTDAPDGATMYPTLEDLKDHSPCWKTCGVVEIEMRVKAVAHPGDGTLPTKEAT